MVRVRAARAGAAACAPAAACALAAMLALPVSPARALDLPPSREVRLPNGALLMLAEKHEVPLIAFQAWIRGGALGDPPGKEGIADLTAQMLRKGAGGQTAQEIAALIDGLGARLSVGSGLEASYVEGEFMARDRARMVGLIADLLRKPTFPADEFEKLKSNAIGAKLAEKDDPQSVIGDYARAFLFGKHPYGRPASGDETTLGSLTREDAVECYRSSYGGDRLILAVVGDFEAASMESMLRAKLADWGRAPAALPEAPPPSRAAGRRVLLVDKPDATQSYFWIGAVGVARGDPDRVALDVANMAYGGRYTSLLNTALRIRGGLTYGARWTTPRYTQAGWAAITSYTKTESTREAIDLALRTLADVRREGLDSLSLAAAKTYIEGQYPTRLETGDQIAGALADLAFYGLARDELTGYTARVAGVPAGDLARVIRRVYPPAEDLTFVIVGNAARIRAVVKKYGTVTEVKIATPLLRAVR
jgi:predicted Zn-dependent peptidase